MTTAVITPVTTTPAEVKSKGIGSRVWNILLEIGERKAADEVARYIRCRGGQPTGDLSKDVEIVRSYVGIR
jgi:hypothetical protein